jgi:hypothetical protein
MIHTAVGGGSRLTREARSAKVIGQSPKWILPARLDPGLQGLFRVMT